jgi:hypothetical protein
VVEIRFISKSGVFVDSLNSITRRGQLLNVLFDITKIGGVQKGTIEIQNINIELSTNFEVQIWRGYYEGFTGSQLEHQFTGYITEAPEYTDDTIKIKFAGYWEKFKGIQNTVTYTNKTISFIIQDLLSTDPFERFNNDFSELNPPTDLIPEIKLENTPLLEVFNRLVAIANKDYQTAQYAFYFDETNRLVFKLMTIQEALFEGYQFFGPQIDQEKPKVNKVYMYTRDPLDSQKTVFRGVVTNTDSVSQYGVKDETIIFPDESGTGILTDLDTNAIVNVSKMLIDRYKDPTTKASIKNIRNFYDQGFLKISTAKTKKKTTVYEGENANNWDLSSVIASTVTVDTGIFLFGNSSLKFALASGSQSDEAIYDFPENSYGVFLFEVYVYCTGGAECTFKLFNESDFKTMSNSIQDQWVKLSMQIVLSLGTEEGDIDYKDGSEEDTMDFSDPQVVFAVDYQDGASANNLDYEDGVDTGAVDGQDGLGEGAMCYRSPLAGGNLFAVNKFALTFDTEVGSVYVDKALISTFNGITKELSIEKQSIAIKEGAFLNTINLGENPDSLIDEIKGEIKPGNIAFEQFKGQ